MKKRYLFLLIFSPIVISITLHVVNYISDVCGGLNLNPVNIGNQEWLSFFGGYIGGVCTLIAFYFTFMQNEKNVENTIDANKQQLELQIKANTDQMHEQVTESRLLLEEQMNEAQRQIKYQGELQDMENQQKIISIAITAVQPLRVIKFLNHFKNTDNNNGEIIDLLSDIYMTQENLFTSRTKLELEASICNGCHKYCDNIDCCALGKIKGEFSDKYYRVLSDITDSCNNFSLFVENFLCDLNARRIIKNANEILNNKFSTDEEKSKAQKDIALAEKNLKDTISEYQKISEDVRKMKNIHVRELNALVALAKAYIQEQRKLARERLENHTVLECKVNQEKMEEMKKEYEEELEKYFKTLI